MNNQHSPETLSLDLKKQYQYFEEFNQFRFTPPTHIVNALNASLLDLELFGGVKERNSKYKKYNKLIKKNLLNLGFKNYELESNSNIISTWYYPEKNFDFNHFYNFLEKNDIIIYPGKLSNENVFRIGNIGDLTENDILYFINCISKYRSNFP